ncbi:MAG TPA: ATP-grasp domain-containing protein [Symbiobacteriaceae bacterium]|nr:ATP-grasp domain-containing protein [Symbiobacteriaceae bacterium]
MKAALTVLLTGAGAPGTRGALYALRHNPDGVQIRAVGTDIRADGVGRLWMDAFHQVPPPEDAGYLAALLEICRREAVELVIPQTTRELFAFARHKAVFEAEGVRVMVADLPAIEVANNKAALLQVVEQMGLPCPTYHLTRSKTELADAAAALGYPGKPVVVKPPVSNGMRGFRVLREGAWDLARFLAEKPNGVEISLDELLAVLGRGAAWPELLVTEYLPGAEYSVDAFLGADLSVAVPRLRRVIRSGISFENELEYRDDLIQATLALGRQVGLKYAFGFQFKLDQNGVPKILECNPRLQGTMVASLFGGVNVIWLGVREALGEGPSGATTGPGPGPTAADPTGAAAAPAPGGAPFRPATFLRFWGGIGLSGDQIDEI